jgi:4-hydroxy-4-methyl-2-oxoglutarate aldolase
MALYSSVAVSGIVTGIKDKETNVYGHIHYNIARPASTLLQAFQDVSTATLSDAMGRHGAMGPEIRPIYENIRMVGSALTVLCFPGDNIMTHKALQMIQPGDVLVIDDGDYNTGCFGHKSALHARAQGGVGIVAGGSVRDVALLRRDRFPTFARGVSPRAPQKNTPGSINVPVHVGGIVVQPGDIVVGDDDGIVVVPLAMAGEILEKAKLRDRREREDSAPGELPLDPAGATLQLDAMLKGKVIEHREPVSWSPRSASGSD